MVARGAGDAYPDEIARFAGKRNRNKRWRAPQAGLFDGAARASDVLALATRLRQRVCDQFGVSLYREVQVWPEEAAAALPEAEKEP